MDPNEPSIKEATSFNLFRNYECNHPESDAIKPKERKSEPEIDWTAKTIPIYEAPAPSQPVSILPFIEEDAAIGECDRQIFLITDVNEMMAQGNYPAAEYLLGRQLTMDELKEQRVTDLLKPNLEKQAREELERERIKERLKAESQKESPSAEVETAERTRRFYDLLVNQGFLPPPPPPGGFAPSAPNVLPPPPQAPVLKKPYQWVPLPPSPVVSAPPSPTHSVASVMSVNTMHLIQEIQALPGIPENTGLELYNRLTELGMPDEQFDDVMLDNDAGFAARLATLNAPADKIKILIPVHRKIVAAEKAQAARQAAPSPPPVQEVHAAAAPKKPTLDFVYDSGGESHILDPTGVRPTKDVMVVIRKQMEAAYPDLAGSQFAGIRSKSTAEEWWAALTRANREIAKRRVAAEKTRKTPVNSPSTKTGTGVGGRKSHTQWVPFGLKFRINADRIKQGVFSLAYNGSGQKPQWTKNQVLSAPLQGCVQAFIRGEPMDIMDLDDEERTWIKTVWENAGITRPKPTPLSLKPVTKAQLLERLKVLLGQVGAGNDNPKLLAEMGAIASKLLMKGWISADYYAKVEQLISLG